ncbi:Phenylacetate-CoA oxygenase subunit PaaC OS=Streptomyces tendae OX=1932 GN=paaC PE=4 SV=1 [Streptomyces tendae]
MRAALDEVAPYLGELHTAYDVRDEVADDLRQVTDAAGLTLPVHRPLPGSGRAGRHTEHLAPLLTELQGVARAHPEATW